MVPLAGMGPSCAASWNALIKRGQVTLDCLCHREQDAAPEVTVESSSAYEVLSGQEGTLGKTRGEQAIMQGSAGTGLMPVCEQSQLSQIPGAS